MPDYSSYRVPRPVEVGREVRLEQRRASNRAAIFAIAGVLVLCVCLGVGLVGVAFAMGLGPFAKDSTSALNFSPRPSATATPVANGTPTAVPYGKSGKDDSGLRLTLTAYQRPLPAQDLQIPDGQELVLVSVRLDNTRTTGGPIKYAPGDFALVSTEGDHFTANLEGITTGELLKSGEIAPGKSAKGDLVFYVYTDVKDLMLAWTSADGTTRVFKLTR
jgi:hypothetical protein